ncbi:MAG TPA: hypothetical protein VF125_00545 [Solirubrobacterales bacterium]
MAEGSSLGCGRGTPYSGGISSGADSEAKVRSAALKRSPQDVAPAAQVEVHPPAPLGPENLVEVALQLSDLRRGGGVFGKQGAVGRPLRARLLDDLRRVGEDPIAPDEHRRRFPPTGTSDWDPVEHLEVRLLPVGDAGPVKRPASLLAVVTDRDRDQGRGVRHRNSVADPALLGKAFMVKI